jgi:diacylglycerol kinase
MIKISKCIKSFSFAFKGIYLLFKNENNARVHLLASLLVVIAGAFSHLDKTEWLWISLAITLVWVTEAVNTAIEKIVDLYSPEFNPRAGVIKDLAAGAVLMTAIFALLVACLIFIPKYF